MFNPLSTVLDKKKSKAKYPEARVIVLDDSFNTFQHVANCLLTIIPGMSRKKAWDHTIKIDKTGSAEVWRGNLEQAELYHEQLFRKGLKRLRSRKHKNN
ncbi:Clp protease ClpS [Prochlorococcus marinus str. MU1402]|nr:ATP-dependent Clp protease adapter ClpS [Prochlorococcus marinus XMU1402]MBW3056748.1 Clp protease ClpS [Prochlorococcus marinus str. MU1402]